MKKLIPFALLLIQALSGLHCAQNGRGDQSLNTVYVNDPSLAPRYSPVLSPDAQMGTVDGGGGAGIDGKPIESFARDIQKLKEYQDVVAPVVEAIGRIHPEYQNVFIHIVKTRNWLFTSKALTNLGKNRQGTPFNVDQWAAQNNKEVWFSDQYQGSTVNKGKILLHEILVGIKLLKYLSENEKCAAQFSAGNCAGTDGAPLVDNYKLNDLDHEDVRTTGD